MNKENRVKKILFGKYEYHKTSNDDKLNVRINLKFGILPAIIIISLIIWLIWLF